MVESIVFGEISGVPLHALFYPAQGARKNKTILYLHGGGLVYGEADDFPEVYVKMISAAGYDLLSLEYPLAPEVKLGSILENVLEGIVWARNHYQPEQLILFGRSAGAYLALLAADRAQIAPEALVLFYGYHTLQEASFRVPSRHYLTFPKVEKRVVDRLTLQKPITRGPKETRFAFYIYYRQSGSWVQSLLAADEKPADYSLSNEDLKQLPPAFVAASRNDPDVPFRISKKLAETIPGSHLEALDTDEHDFDRISVDGIGKEVYQKMLDWLGNSHA